MARIVLPRKEVWTRQPQGAARISQKLRGAVSVWLGSQPNIDLKRNASLSIAGGSSIVGGPGIGVALSVAANNGVLLASSSLTLIPSGTAACTIAVWRRSQDTTARSVTLFGMDNGASDRAMAHAPYSDGNLYWDFGNATGGSGRVSTSFTKSTTPEVLVFTAGPGRGREVWRNGIRIASDASATAAYSGTGGTFRWGGASATASDSDEFYLGVIALAEWTPAEIREWSAGPYGATFARPAARVFMAGAGGSPDVTVALSGQAATAAAGTLVPSSSVPLSGQSATISAGTLTPTYSRVLSGTAVTASVGTLTPSLAKALSGTAVTVSAGTLTPSTTVALSGQSVTVSAGTITYSAGSDISLALTGAAVTASAGTLGLSSTVSLAGSAVTVSAGSVVPTFPRTLSGSAVTASAGTVTPSMAVPLVGQSVTVSAGTLAYAPQGDVTVALTGEAVTAYAGTLTASGGDVDSPFYGYGNLGPSVRKKKKKPGPRPKTLREQLEETYEQLAAKPSVPPAVAPTADSPTEKSEAEVQPIAAPSAKLVAKSDEAADEAQERQDVAAEVRETLQVANQPILEWLAHINQNVTELHAKLDRMEEQRKQARRKAQHDLLLG